MKKTQIFKQSFELTNDFNNDACVKTIKNQIADSAFKELINGEKHSLTIDFIISVNEEETHELDPKMLQALKIVQMIQNLTDEQINDPSKFDLLNLWFHSKHVDTSLLNKHNVEL